MDVGMGTFGDPLTTVKDRLMRARLLGALGGEDVGKQIEGLDIAMIVIILKLIVKYLRF